MRMKFSLETSFEVANQKRESRERPKRAQLPGFASIEIYIQHYPKRAEVIKR